MNPVTKLDVEGMIKLKKHYDPPAICDVALEGAVALQSSGEFYRICVCDGSEWTANGEVCWRVDCHGDYDGRAYVNNCGVCDADPVNDCMQSFDGLIWQAGTAAAVFSESQVLLFREFRPHTPTVLISPSVPPPLRPPI